MATRPRRAEKEKVKQDEDVLLSDEALLEMCGGDFEAAMQLRESFGADVNKTKPAGGKPAVGKGKGKGRKREEEEGEEDVEAEKPAPKKKGGRGGRGAPTEAVDEDRPNARARSEMNAGPSKARGVDTSRARASAVSAGPAGKPAKVAKVLPNDARALHKHYKTNSVQEMAFLQAIEDDAVKSLMKHIRRNYEPYRQGPWRREPWPAREYAQLDVNCIAEDCPFPDDIRHIQAKLLTDKRAGPGQERKEMDLRSVHFGWTLDKVPSPLVDGTDFSEQPCWGLDCFTRANLEDALLHCPGLVPAGANGAESRRLREDFVEYEVLPSLNRAGDLGWDVVHALGRRACEAREAGVDAVARVMTRLRDIIEGVEAAHGFQRGSEAYMAAFTADIDPSAIEALDALKAADRRDFRAHPKGMGIVCTRPGGVPAGTFVAEWAGEVYPPWRWFEKQDAFKKKNPHASLPDFYNIMLERPRDDAMGYDVLFVDSSVRGNFTSRMSHSCTPNCHTMPMSAEGRVCIAFVAIRDIREGEELTWDYNSVTESEREFKEAICLCGTRSCRGSFLHYANNRSFQEVLSRDLLFLQRTAMIVRGVQEPLGPEDEAALARLGIKTAALAKELIIEAPTRDPVPRDRLPPGIPRSAYVEVPSGDVLTPSGPVVMPRVVPLPDWVRKWAALIAAFIERERRELPGLLVEKSREYIHSLNNPVPVKEDEEELLFGTFDDVHARGMNPFLPKRSEATYTHEYSLEEADELAAGVRENRIQNLIITIDKVRYFLREAERVAGQEVLQRPLRPLTCAEIVEHLWTGPASIIKKFALRSIPVTCHGLAARGRVKSAEPDYVSNPALVARADDGPGWQSALAMRRLLDRAPPTTAAQASARVLEFAELLRDTGLALHAAAYDSLVMYAKTKHWFTVWAFDKGVKSMPVTSWWDTTAAPADLELAAAIARGAPGPTTRRAVQEAVAHAGGAAASPSHAPIATTPVKGGSARGTPAKPVSAKGTPRGAGAGAGVDRGGLVSSPAAAFTAKSPSQTPMGRQRRLALQLAMGDGDLRKKYTPHYVWGQLSNWMKQTIYDPSASLSADRRGCLSLPDPETCYQSSFLSYARTPAKGESDRTKLLEMIERDPNAQWPTTFFFRFQNPGKVYGSPMFDWAIAMTQGKKETALKEMLQGLRETVWEYKPRVANRGDKKRTRDDPQGPEPLHPEAALARRSGRERVQAPSANDITAFGGTPFATPTGTPMGSPVKNSRK